MPRERDSLWDFVSLDAQNEYRCKFCNKPIKGGITRFKGHFAGMSGFGAKPCKNPNPQVKEAARQALKSIVRPSNVPHWLGSASSEDDQRGTSSAAMPNQGFGVISTAGASSLPFNSVRMTSFPNQPAQTTIQQQDTPSSAKVPLFCASTQTAGGEDLYAQLTEFSPSYASTLNAGGGDLHTQFPPGEMCRATDTLSDWTRLGESVGGQHFAGDGRYLAAVNGQLVSKAVQAMEGERAVESRNNVEGSTSLRNGPYQPWGDTSFPPTTVAGLSAFVSAPGMNVSHQSCSDQTFYANNGDARRDTSFTPTTVAGLSAFVSAPGMNVSHQSCSDQTFYANNGDARRDTSFAPTAVAGLSAFVSAPGMNVSHQSCSDHTHIRQSPDLLLGNLSFPSSSLDFKMDASANTQYPPNAEVRDVNPEVRQGKRARAADPSSACVEVLNGYGRAKFIGRHSAGDAWREFSSAASLSQSSSVTCTANASSPLSIAGTGMNFDCQSHFAQTMTEQRQPWILSYSTNARRVNQHIDILQGSTDENLECHSDEAIVEPIGTQSPERAPQTSMRQAQGTQINRPIAAVESRSAATGTSNTTNIDDPYKELINVLDSIPDIAKDEELYYFAISHLKEKIDHRQIFINLNTDAKKVKYLNFEKQKESSLHR